MAASIPMSVRLTRENLRGIWAAIPTPFNETGGLDLGVFRENIRRLHAGGVDGIYTTDADGEFYGIELDEFRRLVTVLGEECRRLGVPTQAGCTWANTAGTIDRLRSCADAGILGAHVGHPFFMPMDRRSLSAFWAAIGDAVPDHFALIHYATPRCPNRLTGADYAIVSGRVPNLVGVKFTGSDFSEFLDLTTKAPGLSYFVSEKVFAPFYPYGARGIYTWFANANAPYLRDWYRELQANQWQQAARRQRRLHEFSAAAQELRDDGYLHGILNKARAAASDFLVPNNRTRAPYLPVPDDQVARFRKEARENFPDLLGPRHPDHHASG
jgi:dihydrodipicolinate synthase/N-acetylneuraminate lyase